MEAVERDFKGIWIPKDVWLDARLNALEKVILAEIDSLDNGERGCYASNDHIAAFCQCSKRKVSESITKLVKLGYLYYESFDGRKRTLRSAQNLRGRVAESAMQSSRNCAAESQNLPQSNKESNTVNNKKRKDRGVEDVLSVYALDDSVKETVYGFLEMRKKIKKPMTDRALKILMNKLMGMTSDREEAIAILNQSIVNCWQNIYPLKDKQKKPDYDGEWEWG